MALKSIMLIVIPAIILVIPGMVYNNMNNNGLVVGQGQALSCSSDTQTPTCQISGNVGCQSNTNYCTFNGASISFLSHTSIFTQMIEGNIFALFTSVNGPNQGGASQTSWSGSHGPFDITGNPLYYSADCQGQPAGVDKSQTQWAMGRCTQTNTDNSNMSEADVVSWNNWNTDWNTTAALQFYQLGNGTFARSCNWIAQINFTAVANGPGWTYFGCTINAAGSVQTIPSNPTHQSWAYLIAMPLSYGKMPAGLSHQHLFVQLTNWFTQNCIPNANLGAMASNACNTFLSSFQGANIPGTNLTFVPNSGWAIAIGFLSGIVLFIAGLGLQVGVGGGVSAGINEQGSKMFQVLGMGLLIWTPLYSEFAGWFTTGILPYGLDGGLGIISIILSGLFFFGIYWRTMARD